MSVILKAGVRHYRWKDERLKDLGIDEALNAFGSEGWELVSIPPYSSGGTVSEYIFVFKKPA